MTRYVYATVKCVPDPRTGEFVTVGAIAGSPETGEWSLRQVSNEARVRRLANAKDLAVVHGFLGRVGQQIDEQREGLDDGASASLSEIWLHELHDNHRNVVQLSRPTPMVANDVESALDQVFSQLIIEPVRQSRPTLTKHRVLSDLRKAYRMADIDDVLVKQSVDVVVGDHVHTSIDFAIANGATLQLSQAWSFQRAGIDEIGLQVKAWGYALSQLRVGTESRVIDASGALSTISRDVDLEVVVAEPVTPEQTRVYQEAVQVFKDLEVEVHSVDQAAVVGRKAAELVSASAHAASRDQTTTEA